MEQELAYSFRLGNDIVNDVKQVGKSKLFTKNCF